MIPEDTRKLHKEFKKKKAQDDIKEYDDMIYREHGSG